MSLWLLLFVKSLNTESHEKKPTDPLTTSCLLCCVPLRCRGGAETKRRKREEVMFSPQLTVTVSSVRV